MITENEITELEHMASEATMGPWRYDDGVTDAAAGERGKPACVECIHETRGHLLIAGPDYGMLSPEEVDANGAFIAATRTAAPKLVAEVRSLQTQLETLADAFVQQVPDYWGGLLNLAPGPELDALFEALRAAKERAGR